MNPDIFLIIHWEETYKLMISLQINNDNKAGRKPINLFNPTGDSKYFKQGENKINLTRDFAV